MGRFLTTYRFWVMWVASAAVVAWYLKHDPNDGQQLAEQLRTMVGALVAAPIVYGLRRAFADRARCHEAYVKAMESPVGAGLVFLGICILTGILFMCFSGRALAAELPAGAVKDLPVLSGEISARWPGMPLRSVLGAQVEQESGWKVRATLHTDREDGVGYAQLTRAYRPDGSIRFDALADVVAMDKSLAGWTWADRYNPLMQLRALVVKNRNTFAHMRRLVGDDYNALAMSDAAYNCGEGCVYARRRLCGQVAGCDPNKWFGHVELYSAQSKTKWKGYGQSAHEITDTHVRNVMVVRRPKYARYFGEV